MGHRYFRVSGQESNVSHVSHSWWMFRLAVQPSLKKPWSRFLGAKTCQLCESGAQGLESWPLDCDIVAYNVGSGDITHTVAVNAEPKTVFQIIVLKWEEILWYENITWWCHQSQHRMTCVAILSHFHFKINSGINFVNKCNPERDIEKRKM